MRKTATPATVRCVSSFGWLSETGVPCVVREGDVLPPDDPRVLARPDYLIAADATPQEMHDASVALRERRIA